jgi:hypothetical protein
MLTITGSVIGTDFNRRGEVMEVAIEENNFNKYIVLRDIKGSELFEKMFSLVTVNCYIIGNDINNNPVIRIEDYKVNNNRIS